MVLMSKFNAILILLYLSNLVRSECPASTQLVIKKKLNGYQFKQHHTDLIQYCTDSFTNAYAAGKPLTRCQATGGVVCTQVQYDPQIGECTYTLTLGRLLKGVSGESQDYCYPATIRARVRAQLQLPAESKSPAASCEAKILKNKQDCEGISSQDAALWYPK